MKQVFRAQFFTVRRGDVPRDQVFNEDTLHKLKGMSIRFLYFPISRGESLPFAQVPPMGKEVQKERRRELKGLSYPALSIFSRAAIQEKSLFLMQFLINI